jgi:hypothetical protein
LQNLTIILRFLQDFQDFARIFQEFCKILTKIHASFFIISFNNFARFFKNLILSRAMKCQTFEHSFKLYRIYIGKNLARFFKILQFLQDFCKNFVNIFEQGYFCHVIRRLRHYCWWVTTFLPESLSFGYLQQTKGKILHRIRI